MTALLALGLLPRQLAIDLEIFAAIRARKDDRHRAPEGMDKVHPRPRCTLGMVSRAD
jgi:hypothetical protein